MKQSALDEFARSSLLCLLMFTGCRSDAVEVNGPQFMKTFDERKPGDKCVFREDSGGFYHLELYRMGKTESLFRKAGTIKTRKEYLAQEQAARLKRQSAEDATANPSPAKPFEIK